VCVLGAEWTGTVAVYKEFTTLCNHTAFQLVLSDSVLQRNYYYIFILSPCMLLSYIV